jgi:YebC/PmpR family DNA-binding regulatory protein
MSGHNKWSSIKHKKGAADAKRGKVFTKLIREITVAARTGGGGDPTGNPRLRAAILLAKSENMPKENIERAIKKGTGELEGVSYEEITYEGYGPGGVAVLVDCLTDNKNRTVSEVKHLFERHGGSLGAPGCVSYLFAKKGLIIIDKDKVDEEKLLDLALESGAEDVKEDGDEFNVFTGISDFETVKKAIDNAGLPYTMAQITMIPNNTVEVEGKKAQQVVNLMQSLEDLDDVSNVYANFDISDEVMEALG